MRTTLISFLILTWVAATAQQFDPARIKNHIQTLASDGFEGRGSGTAGEQKANDYLEREFQKLQLAPKGTSGFDQPFTFKAGIHGTGREGTAQNIMAYLDNGAAHTIIIGAHYDHLGLGLDGNSTDANPQNKIHNGADDNASGTAGVLELARYFATNKTKEKNNFLFICFSGEELGLYGSKYFTEHPTVSLASVNYMINMDMIGRLPASGELLVSGTGTSPVWEPVLQKLNTGKIKVKTDSAGLGPSDHASFYLKDIPVLHFFTGSHSDYHKPTDDWEKINYEGEAEVLSLIARLIESLDGEPKLKFLKTKNKQMGSARAFKVTLGVMPSYTSTEEGLLIDGVSDGKPAQKAGLMAGDVITAIGEVEIKNIQHYMDALGKFEKGQIVPVKVKRKGEVQTYLVTF